MALDLIRRRLRPCPMVVRTAAITRQSGRSLSPTHKEQRVLIRSSQPMRIRQRSQTSKSAKVFAQSPLKPVGRRPLRVRLFYQSGTTGVNRLRQPTLVRDHSEQGAPFVALPEWPWNEFWATGQPTLATPSKAEPASRHRTANRQEGRALNDGRPHLIPRRPKHRPVSHYEGDLQAHKLDRG
jgi:hypothetical protein